MRYGADRGGEAQTALCRPVRSLLTAVGFLTIVPVPLPKGDEHYPFGAALFYFTVVGLLIGLAVAAAGAVMNTIAAAPVTAVLLVLLLSLASGFLHMDGMADTADGFLSSRNRERSLEIMRDSRIGVMGAVAVSSTLLLKSAAVYAVAGENLTGAIVIAAVGGRAAMVLAIHFQPYARSEPGLGTLFSSGAGGYAAPLTAIIILLSVIIVVQPAQLFVSVVMFVLVLIAFSAWCVRKIGGYTGDTLGCLCELMETGLLLAAGFTI